ncbi:NAD(P)-dependent alcohol dehydrogenase [Pengzhenrongella sicca]|uniref:NAD(P)-dependent alcohol dehydrogenase n=1 Tax=Pengzhenrongella sicca TaxID=2819238 RepID=A0A8A4ZA58_9MICO|nr:NAD(P)-dependent alcohol dehydrogenase [Pengzhenrongella sicca]QTE27773.1 NAD(P)-dependent alcohol dehydrogenase [Pengzhenrongella sicca]
MKAAVSTRYGPPAVVRVVDVPAPAIGADDVLVRVRVATVNRTDCGFRAGQPVIVRAFSGVMRPRAHVLGSEFAGVVEAVGAAVTSFAVGDRVFGYAEDQWGAHAEYLAIPAAGPIAAIPANVTFEQAAASTEASHYALASLRKARVRTGHDVLVNGATGAIGSAAVQLLAAVEVTVTAVCDGAHADLVRGLGAYRVIDRTVEDFTQDRHSYDVVFDAVSKSTFGRCRSLLRPGGTYASTDLGPWGQNVALSLVTPLLSTWLLDGKTGLLPLPPTYDQALVQYFGRLLETGRFSPVIDRSYPLDQIVEAYEYVETGQKIGNVLLRVGDPAAH